MIGTRKSRAVSTCIDGLSSNKETRSSNRWRRAGRIVSSNRSRSANFLSIHVRSKTFLSFHVFFFSSLFLGRPVDFGAALLTTISSATVASFSFIPSFYLFLYTFFFFVFFSTCSFPLPLLFLLFFDRYSTFLVVTMSCVVYFQVQSS